MYSSAYVWAKIVSYLEERLGAITVSTHLDDAEVVELNDLNLIIYSSSDFRREIIRKYPNTFAVMDPVSEVMGNFKSYSGDGKPVKAILDRGDGKTM